MIYRSSFSLRSISFQNALTHANALVSRCFNRSSNRRFYTAQLIGIFSLINESLDNGEQPLDILAHSVSDPNEFVSNVLRRLSDARYDHEVNITSSIDDSTPDAAVPGASSSSVPVGIVTAPVNHRGAGRPPTTRVESVPAAMQGPPAGGRERATCSFCHLPGHTRARCEMLRELGSLVRTESQLQAMLQRTEPAQTPVDWLPEQFTSPIPTTGKHVIVHAIVQLAAQKYAARVTVLDLSANKLPGLDNVYRDWTVITTLFTKKGSTRCLVDGVGRGSRL